MDISDLGLPDDHLLDDHNSIDYPRHRHGILIILILFTTCLILLILASIFIFIFTKKQHPLVPIKDPIDSNSIQDHSRIKVGQIFGNSTGFTFDDSSMENFTSSYYLRGVIIRLDSDCLGWIQCFYSADNHPENILQGETHGLRETTDVGEPFFLENDEKIFKVQVKVDNVQLYENGNPSMNPRMIKNIRFFTTKGRSSPQIDQFRGKMFTEEFEGYTLAYLTGSTGRYINQLQFYWYQTINN